MITISDPEGNPPLGFHPAAENPDLSDIVKTWRREAAVEAALASQDRVDEDLWK